NEPRIPDGTGGIGAKNTKEEGRGKKIRQDICWFYSRKYKEIIKKIQKLNKLLLQNYANGNKECILISTTVYRKIYSLPIMGCPGFTTKMNLGYLYFGVCSLVLI
ncbi:hypothetical protein MEN41_21770, partial [Dolichospermum sp. ST_con]|nr:hypothetical protein [Dolichospermum sp. ST_con]